MNAQMVLPRAVHGSWEGWRCMALDEFVQQLDLKALKAGQLLVGDPSNAGGATAVALLRGRYCMNQPWLTISD
jgi:hypothetical protein